MQPNPTSQIWQDYHLFANLLTAGETAALDASENNLDELRDLICSLTDPDWVPPALSDSEKENIEIVVSGMRDDPKRRLISMASASKMIHALLSVEMSLPRGERQLTDMHVANLSEMAKDLNHNMISAAADM